MSIWADSICNEEGYYISTHDTLGQGTITEVTVSEGIEEIGDGAFNSSIALVRINLPSTLRKMGYAIIEYCPKLTELNIPYGITSIGFGALSDHYESSIETIEIPESVNEIEARAFEGRKKLKTVKISKNVTNIDSSAFDGCNNLENIDIDENNKNYKSIDGILYSKDGTRLILDFSKKTNITIPNSVVTIEKEAFNYRMNLEQINIPDSVTSIGEGAFCGCMALKNITIPNSVTKIESSAFSSCESLTSITIPNSVTSIGEYAFYGCKALKNITIPNSVTKIESSAFSSCESLTSITIPSSVKIMGVMVFAGDTTTVNVFFKENEKPEGWNENWKEGYWNSPSKITVNYAK